MYLNVIQVQGRSGDARQRARADAGEQEGACTVGDHGRHLPGHGPVQV